MTPMQNRLYQYLLDRIDEPVGPSYDDMASAMGLRSKAGVARLLDALAEQGLITRIPRRDRSTRARRRNVLDGVSSETMIDELKRRGEWPHGR